jgi:Ca-activated chloride channel family protein
LGDPQACTDTELLIPIGPIAKPRLVETVNAVQLKGKTPLVLSVLEAIKDFAKIPNGSVILITDGIESCGGDIKAIAPAIKKSGLDINVNIVGFDIREEGGREQLESIASSTGGMYLDAKNAAELLSALEQTLKLDYVVLDAAGAEVGRGTVGGGPLKLGEGAYTIRILLAPKPVELKLTVKSGTATTLTLKKTQSGWILE